MNKLFPIHRSLMGKGNKDTLNIIKKIIPIKIKNFKSLQKVFDWQIPKEWKIKSAWIKDFKGKK